LFIVVGLLLVGLSTALAAQDNSFKPLQQSARVLSTNLRGFGIPFNVANQDGQFIEVQLYYSEDLGQTWNFHSRQPISGKEFPFAAKDDGEYWFAIKTLDRHRRLLPDGDVQPELKIIVDSNKPDLNFQIESDAAGRVVCRWQATDAGLDSSSFEIRYRATEGPMPSNGRIDETWKSVPVQLQNKLKGETWADQLAWWPETDERQLEVQIQIADKAGNLAQASRYVSVRPTTWRKSESGSTLKNTSSPFSQASTSPNPVFEVNEKDAATWKRRLKPIVDANANLAPIDESQTASPLPKPERWRINEASQSPGIPSAPALDRSVMLPPGVEVSAPPVPLNWQPEPTPPAPQPTFSDMASGSVTWESEVQREEASERSFSGSTMGPAPEIAPALDPSRPRTTDSIPSNPGTTVRSGENIISESTTSWPNNQWSGPPASKAEPLTALAPGAGRMVAIERTAAARNPNMSQFSSAGFRKPAAPSPSRQSTLSQSEQMPDSANTQIISTKRFELNYDINAIDPSGVGRVDLWMTRDRGQTWKMWGQDPDNVSPFPVEVTEEGIFGFRIVVRSKDGLAGRGPMRGEEADMWVQVDVTAPLTKITSVPYGRGSEAGQLIINYAVSDSNLALRPNRILWSTNPDGPWTSIEEDLRNEGRLAWKPQQNVPHRIFLRLESIDRAGNLGVHNLSQAIDISGLVPRGTIFGVNPVGQ
jgi:hypothetical protein